MVCVGFDVSGDAVVLGDGAVEIKAAGHLVGGSFDKVVGFVDGGKGGKGIGEDL